MKLIKIISLVLLYLLTNISVSYSEYFTDINSTIECCALNNENVCMCDDMAMDANCCNNNTSNDNDKDTKNTKSCDKNCPSTLLNHTSIFPFLENIDILNFSYSVKKQNITSLEFILSSGFYFIWLPPKIS